MPPLKQNKGCLGFLTAGKGRKGLFRYAFLPALVAVGVLLLVRTFLFTPYAVPSDRPDLGLIRGDRVGVVRMAYGWSAPFPNIFGYRVLGKTQPQRGDIVAFTANDGSGTVLLDRILALPGDTVRGLHSGIVPDNVYLAGTQLIDHRQLLGRASVVVFSVDDEQPFYKALRSKRFFVRPDSAARH